MKKYKSEIINEDELIIETDTYTQDLDLGDEIKMFAVKLKHIVTGLEVAVHTYKGEIFAYNCALKKLEDKLKELR